MFTQHLGMRGRKEDQSMKNEHFQFKKSDQGTKNVTFSKAITKTRQRGLHNKDPLTIPKIFSTDTERCSAHFFKFFLSKRPKCLQNNSPFSIFVIVNPKSGGWYEVTLVGVNKINEIMKEIYANSNLECNKRTAIH